MPAAVANAAARIVPDLQPSSRKGSRCMTAMHSTCRWCAAGQDRPVTILIYLLSS